MNELWIAMNEWKENLELRSKLDSGFRCEWEKLCSFLIKPSKPAIDNENLFSSILGPAVQL